MSFLDETNEDLALSSHQLEQEVFGPGLLPGISWHRSDNVEMTVEGFHPAPIADFRDADLHPAMLRTIELMRYNHPTPIQTIGIPAINTGRDVIAVAHNGTGKTAAYLISILGKLMGKAKELAAPRPNPAEFVVGIDEAVRAEPLVVIVCPSRMLAIQTFNETRKFCYQTMLRPCVVFGQCPLESQVQQLCKGCDVLVATPDVLVELIFRPEVLTLQRLRHMVIDEADLTMAICAERNIISQMFRGGGQDRRVQRVLIGATAPGYGYDLAKRYMAPEPIRIWVGPGSIGENIRQVVIPCLPSQKLQLLHDTMLNKPAMRTVIFVNEVQTVEAIDDYLTGLGVPCTSMHVNRSQREREAAIRGFRAGESPVLVTQGWTARGIDVRNVFHVINYDLPSDGRGRNREYIHEYIHRIGRTGRIGRPGLATSFFTESDEPLAPYLTRVLLETGQGIPRFLQEYVPEGQYELVADSEYSESDTEYSEADTASGEETLVDSEPESEGHDWDEDTLV